MKSHLSGIKKPRDFSQGFFIVGGDKEVWG